MIQQEIATPDNKPIQSCKVRSQKIEFGTTKWLTYTAVFAALSLVMKFVGQFLTLTPSFKITLIYTVWLVGAATLGPIAGGAICFISDVLGALLFPTGAINPLLTLGCTLYGVIAALSFKYFPVKNNVAKFIFSGVICTLLITLLFDSFAIWYWCKYYLKLQSFMDRSFIAYIGASRLMQLAVGAVNIIITIALVPLLQRLKMLPVYKNKAAQDA